MDVATIFEPFSPERTVDREFGEEVTSSKGVIRMIREIGGFSGMIRVSGGPAGRVPAVAFGERRRI